LPHKWKTSEKLEKIHIFVLQQQQQQLGRDKTAHISRSPKEEGGWLPLQQRSKKKKSSITKLEGTSK
jgi:hypothetical protein